MTLGDALMAAQQRLSASSDSPRFDADCLMSQVTGFSRAQLLTRMDEDLSENDLRQFERWVARRARGEPVAYLTGEKGFWTLNLRVTPAVLVPRPETELLVEWALDMMRGLQAPRIADLGTGSGAIALALASERGDAQVDATDASAAALAIAQENARTLGLPNVRFALGHWFEPLADTAYDLLVSNPPYIAQRDPHLEALRHEPLSALSDGADGLNALREIVAGAPSRLQSGGRLLVEHGYDQGAAVRALFEQAGFVKVETRRDLGDRERATTGVRQ